MLMADVQVFPDTQTLFQAAAERITNTLETIAPDRHKATLVLSGGSTPQAVYRLLVTSPYRERIPWHTIDFFWGDERCVPPTDPASNFKMAWDSLLSRVAIAEGRIHRISGEHHSPEEAALAYESEIRTVCGLVPAPPRFDLVLLGLGDDGHTASLFPGTEWDDERLVIANFIPKLQAMRISMTPRILNAAAEVLFLTAGIEKADALAGVVNDPKTHYPAALIKPHSGSLTWMADRAAASRFSG
jgi:6-phosphogluconolactonase